MLLEKYLLLTIFIGQCIKQKIKVDKKFAILAILAFVYSVTLYISADRFSSCMILLPVAYLVGLNWQLDSKHTENNVVRIFLCLSLGMCLHVFLNCIASIVQNHGFNYSGVTSDFWSSGVYSSSTGQMVNFTMAASMFTYVLVKRGKYLLSLILILPSLLYGVVLGNRTSLLIFAISLVAGTTILIYNKRIRKAKLAIIFLVSIFVIGLFAIYNNWFGISNVIEKSYLLRRLNYYSSKKESILSTERWATKWEYIRNAPSHLFGGGKLRQIAGDKYAHDILLDTLNEGGILSLIPLLTYLILMIKNTVNFIRKSDSLEIKVLFVPYLILVLIQLMLEPVISGAPVFVLSVVLLDGVIVNANKMRDNDENRISV